MDDITTKIEERKIKTNKSKYKSPIVDIYSLDSLVKRINLITEIIYYFNLGLSISKISEYVKIERRTIYRVIESNLNKIRLDERDDSFSRKIKKRLSGENNGNKE